jgi:hypothetical protein
MDIGSTSVTYMYDDNILNPNPSGVNISDDINKINEEDDDELINNILFKTNKQSINRGWNDKNETLIISIGENAASYKYMHERSAEICNTIHNIFKITLIICSTLLTVITTTPEASISFSLVIVRYVFTYLVTLLSVLLHFLQYAYISERHNQAAAEFGIIYHDIQQQMCLYRRDRYIAFKYLSKILKKYDTLIMISPRINSYVLRQFKKTFVSSNTSIPEIAKKIQKIDIISELHLGNSSNSNKSNNDNDNGNINCDNSSSGSSEGNNEFQINSKGPISNMNSSNINSSNINSSNINSNQINMNSFMIHGDITDNDIEYCNPQNIKKLRERFFKENATYEYMRFLHNENE